MIRCILSKKDITHEQVAAIVLAGGQGTRLFPLTESRCKPAVAFGGRYRLIDIPISNSLNSNITRIFVLAQYYASGLHQHIMATFRQELLANGGIDVLSPEEKPYGKLWFSGTADAVRQNIEHIFKSPADYFLILSGDQLYKMDFMPMIQFAQDHGADLVIASLPVKETEAKRMGLLKLNQSSKVIDFIEKPQQDAVLKKFIYEKDHYLGSMGIYVFRREALLNLLMQQGDDFGKHLIPIQMEMGKTFSYVYDGYWEDIGTIRSYYEANLALLNKKQCLDIYDENHPIYTCPYNLPSPLIRNTKVVNSLVSQGAIIDAAEIENSIIGIRARIKKNTKISNSIIMGNHIQYPLPIGFSIGENCVLDKVIVDEESVIGNHVKLINKDKHKVYDGNGIFIRDGIIIVTTGAHIPDHFVL